MKKRISDSEYQFNSPFSLSLRVISYLADCLILILFVILSFRLVDMLFTAYDGKTKELNALIQENRGKVVGYFSEAELMIYDEAQNVALEDAVQGKYFIYSLVLSTLKEEVADANAYGEKYIYGDCNEKNRSVIYYYAEFKEAQRENFKNYDGAKSGFGYVKDLFLSACGREEYFDGEHFPLLQKNVALALDGLITANRKTCVLDGETYYADDIYVNLYNAFKDIVQAARNELSQSYMPYSELESAFNAAREELVKRKIGGLSLSYAASAAVCFLLVPLLTKGQTAAQMFLRGRVIHVSGTKLHWYNYLLRFLWNFILFYGNIAFVILLSYGRYSSFFMMSALFGGFRFYMVYLVSIVFLLASFIVMLPDRTNRRTLVDRLSLTSVKNKE